ncbi:hypothetical protein MJG53_008726 [Ovis ammon polii x Ovis aries]|uniref:Uncharacterized protein n=1 Tax=Ovis ammon polii x Ovis aries TaxID=2918886 RepID=A0ACB9V1C6_9CETA|nr:hypothetical protein MJG53_008726 [Ovis ammon polii x Ovis aries]
MSPESTGSAAVGLRLSGLVALLSSFLLHFFNKPVLLQQQTRGNWIHNLTAFHSAHLVGWLLALLAFDLTLLIHTRCFCMVSESRVLDSGLRETQASAIPSFPIFKSSFLHLWEDEFTSQLQDVSIMLGPGTAVEVRFLKRDAVSLQGECPECELSGTLARPDYKYVTAKEYRIFKCIKVTLV